MRTEKLCQIVPPLAILPSPSVEVHRSQNTTGLQLGQDVREVSKQFLASGTCGAS